MNSLWKVGRIGDLDASRSLHFNLKHYMGELSATSRPLYQSVTSSRQGIRLCVPSLHKLAQRCVNLLEADLGDE